MKRDVDLFREILFKLENKQSITLWETLEIEGYSDNQVNYHIKLLDEADFLEAQKQGQGVYFVRNLKQAGHDFLEAARNDKVWNRYREYVKEKSEEGGLYLATEILKKLGKAVLNME